MITVTEFTDLAISNDIEIMIWNCEVSDYVFKGAISEIPTELENYDITSWELFSGKIILNIDTAE